MDCLEKDFQRLNVVNAANNEILELQNGAAIRRIGPSVPPKPMKKEILPEIPQSRQTACKPLYSQRLQFVPDSRSSEICGIAKPDMTTSRPPLLQRKKPFYTTPNTYDSSTLSKVTLDNPAVLEQQLEVLAHHKRQLEKRGLLPNSSLLCAPKLSSTSLASSDTEAIYANGTSKRTDTMPSYSNVNAQRKFFENIYNTTQNNQETKIYSNIDNFDTNSCLDQPEDDIPAPPSPVSSSYSELRRATDVFATKRINNPSIKPDAETEPASQSYMNLKYNTATGNATADFACYSPSLQGSSTYESIYEPINPRPPSQLSSGSFSYSPYINSTLHSTLPDNSILSNSSSLNLSGIDTSHDNLSLYSSSGGTVGIGHSKPESEVEALTGYLVHSMDNENDVDSYGICFKCNERVLGESSGCTAMNQVYHIVCFTCSQCQVNLQGKPFYALEGKPYCEYDYLQTLEKCSVCMKPILERILRATGKPYHPQCFTCVVCGKSLDGIPFTVDATNQNYCIEDFHKKFAPRCCVCKEPIMPEPGEEETVRVVALDRSFHFECYKCEDCGLLLSSEAEGRGCYPLDDHVLCKSCNAQRVQLLTNRITTEL